MSQRRMVESDWTQIAGTNPFVPAFGNRTAGPDPGEGESGLVGYGDHPHRNGFPIGNYTPKVTWHNLAGIQSDTMIQVHGLCFFFCFFSGVTLVARKIWVRTYLLLLSLYSSFERIKRRQSGRNQ